MNRLFKPAMLAIAAPVFGTLFPMAAQADEDPPCFYESRRGVLEPECGIYHSEIGNSDAYVQTVVNREKWPRWSTLRKGDPQPIILDVRSTPEYKAGHPEHSYNVPYPFIYQYCDDVPGDDRRPDGACVSGGDRIRQEVEDFVSYVEGIAPDLDTPIYTMCRTGVRSVGAANRLTEAGYTNVRNMWEGFVGIYLKAPQEVCDEQGENCSIQDAEVDLNHDGQFTDEDKNGWRYHQGLPYETRLRPRLIYWPYASTYTWE